MTRDAITVELVKNALESIADEMAVTMACTAWSFVLKEAMDRSTPTLPAPGVPDSAPAGRALPHPVSRPPSYLHQPADRPRRPPEVHPGAAGPRLDPDHARPLQPP